MDRLQPFDNTPDPNQSVLAESFRRREQELEAQIAELKQDKNRLLGLLDQALTALNRHTQHASDGMSPPTPHAPTRTTAKEPPKKLQPGTWAWLKDWFLNA